ncbi:hypothetical protein RIEGSTA812A_PEG_806 [invertebrate metagenome]|uniref:Uncharacterized protein n=1 Tax=invertebrate metagenome TaxID=1711999 RepID=A0A484H932_9ZZZZ
MKIMETQTAVLKILLLQTGLFQYLGASLCCYSLNICICGSQKA